MPFNITDTDRQAQQRRRTHAAVWAAADEVQKEVQDRRRLLAFWPLENGAVGGANPMEHRNYHGIALEYHWKTIGIT